VVDRWLLTDIACRKKVDGARQQIASPKSKVSGSAFALPRQAADLNSSVHHRQAAKSASAHSAAGPSTNELAVTP
jgi:hypothetical protein